MTHLFICRKCCKNIYNVCAYVNSSTAFPYHILKDLRCVAHPNMTPNWEYVEDKYLHIPVIFKSDLSQDKIRLEAIQR